MEQPSNWTLVVAMAESRVIGRNGDLPWRLSSDLRRFKELTMGHCLLMGRKTMDSIGKALPGRQTIVLSRSGYQSDAPVQVAAGLDQVDALVEPGRRVMVVGGAQIYALAMPRCSEMFITRVQAEVDGDTFFPEIPADEWQLDQSEPIPAGPRDDYPTEFQRWTRIHQL